MAAYLGAYAGIRRGEDARAAHRSAAIGTDEQYVVEVVNKTEPSEVVYNSDPNLPPASNAADAFATIFDGTREPGGSASGSKGPRGREPKGPKGSFNGFKGGPKGPERGGRD